MRCLLLIPLLLLGSCGGSSTEPGPKKPARAGKLKVVEATPALEGAAGPARVTGRGFLDGAIPSPRRLNEVRHTAGCLTKDHPAPLDDRRLVDGDGGIANVVVRLLRAPQAPAPPEEPVVIDQVDCVFVPHVVALQAGRPVMVKNSDGILHNARLSALSNPSANLSLGPMAAPVPLELPEPEICRLTCDIHPWMTAQVVIVEHPWFAVTGADGTFEIPDVPPGTYGLEAWHEVYGRLRLKELVVPPGGTVEVLATFRP